VKLYTVYKALNTLAAPYLSDNCQLVATTGRRQLRSSDNFKCTITGTSSRPGDGAFAAAGPRLWNSLPTHAPHLDLSLDTFCHKLKVFESPELADSCFLARCTDFLTCLLDVFLGLHEQSYHYIVWEEWRRPWKLLWDWVFWARWPTSVSTCPHQELLFWVQLWTDGTAIHCVLVDSVCNALAVVLQCAKYRK